MTRTIPILLILAASAVGSASAEVNFTRDVRPILADACFNCHGIDPESRKAKLRLDTAEGAAKVIVPGKPEESELIYRIYTDDEDDRMPHKDHPFQLSDAQRATLKQWVNEGAPYMEHWAFVAPTRPELAEGGHPIDAIVNDSLAKKGRTMNPEAARETLIRRLSYDLTGLPPTPAEVDAFLADTSPDAYEKLVDKLLASPRYGERMAMWWLDGARYADTHGYQADWERYQWPWRDWVIRAFNDNKPFDEFTIEQLAGDLLPDASVDQIVATGFNRNHRINTEGGSIDAEWLVENVIDRVETTGAVWLGLTLGCARCHDHKYDPVSQKEFYQIFAFFHNVPEQGKGPGKQGNFAPVVRLPQSDMQERAEEIEVRIAHARTSLTEIKERYAKKPTGKEKWQAATDVAMISKGGAELKRLDDGSFLATGKNPENDTYKIRINDRMSNVTGIMVEAIPHETLTNKSLARSVNGNYVLSGIRSEKVKFVSASADYEQKDWPVKNALDGKNGTGWAVSGNTKAEKRQAVFTFEKATPAPFGFQLEFLALDRHIMGRVKVYVTTAESPELPGKVAEPKEVKKARTALAKLEAEKKKISQAGPTVMVMQEMDKPRDTFVLNRGQYDDPGEKVTAGIPAAFPPLPDGAPANRLGFAQWVVAPENPLTARVQVNRFWEMFFGTGLVKSSENFGTQAEQPSNPELLDWLATEFVRLDWDVKAMLRTILTSATYKQSSYAPVVAYRDDPENTQLARGPRLRVQAEMVRDGALSMAGLLKEKIGGPSVYPYQPPGIWSEFNFYGNLRNYKHAKDGNQYRRSLYTIWKRTAAPPGMTLFDMPSREMCTVKRSRTNTPLQALALMNDVTYVEASRALAERMMKEGGKDLKAWIAYGFRLATARQATEEELLTLGKGYQRRLAFYKKDEAAAKALISQGESKADEKIDAAPLAALTTVASVLLNLDETITKE